MLLMLAPQLTLPPLLFLLQFSCRTSSSSEAQALPFRPAGHSKLQDKPTKADTAVMMDNVCKWIMAVRAGVQLCLRV